MPVKDIFKLIERLCGESPEREAQMLLGEFAPVSIDSIGNLSATLPGQKPGHILLEAHLDQIALVVTHVDDDGFLSVAKSGGVDLRVLAGEELLILTDKPLLGVVCSTPPHIRSDDKSKLKAEDLYIDTGLGILAKEHIPIGTRVVFNKPPKMLTGGQVTAPALDNRAGVIALLLAGEMLRESNQPLPNVTILLSNHEELGNRGAKTGAFAAAADMAISVDVSFGQDKTTPPHKAGKLNGGPMIGISPVLSKRMTGVIIELAKRGEIPYQTEVMGGVTGTNADVIALTKSGVETGLLSIPLKNMHTAVETAALDDVKNTARLICEFVKTKFSEVKRYA